MTVMVIRSACAVLAGLIVALIFAVGVEWTSSTATSETIIADRDHIPTIADTFFASKAGDEREVLGIRLCWCPPGKFRMGSPDGEVGHRPDEAQVDVILSHGFWMGKYEVTQGDWQRLVGPLPGHVGAGEGPDMPVHSVNFPEAEEFCRKLTVKAQASGELPGEWGFRLPSEAQWEYACRAGTTSATAFGNSLNRRQANFQGKPYNTDDDGPSLNRASKVGSYPPNPWGLCDLHGNVFEWCRDWYHAKLPGGKDPDLYNLKGDPNRDGTYSRVRRGGAWTEDGWPCRSACRIRFEPERRSDHIGFRIVAVRQAR